jgi:hypothetical protein
MKMSEALEAETERADSNAVSCAAFVKALRAIERHSSDPYAKLIARNALAQVTK